MAEALEVSYEYVRRLSRAPGFPLTGGKITRIQWERWLERHDALMWEQAPPAHPVHPPPQLSQLGAPQPFGPLPPKARQILGLD